MALVDTGVKTCNDLPYSHSHEGTTHREHGPLHCDRNEDVRDMLRVARELPSPVYLRDHDTGRSIDRNGPMSHAWLMCEWLNTGSWLA